MPNQIFVVVKRTENYDEEIAYRETEAAALIECQALKAFNPSDKYFVIPKKVFGLNPE